MKKERNWEDLKNMVYEINSYNNDLEWLHYYDNDTDFYEIYFENAESAVRACYYGGKNFNYMDDFVAFDGYGNLKSVNVWEYERLLLDNEDEIVSDYNDYLEETGAL